MSNSYSAVSSTSNNFNSQTAINGGLTSGSSNFASNTQQNTSNTSSLANTNMNGQFAIATSSLGLTIDPADCTIKSSFDFEEKSMLEYGRVSSGLYKTIKDICSTTNNYFSNVLMEEILLIRNKYFQQPTEAFKEEDFQDIMGFSIPFMKKVSIDDLPSVSIPGAVTVFLQYFSEKELKEIHKKFKGQYGWLEVDLAITTKSISEEFFEEILSDASNIELQHILINSYVMNNHISNEFLKKYYKQITLWALAKKRRKSFTKEIERIINREFKAPDRYADNQVYVFPQETIRNLKIPTDILWNLVSKNSENLNKRISLYKQIFNSIIFNGNNYPISMDVIEKTDFIERNNQTNYKKRFSNNVNCIQTAYLNLNNNPFTIAYGSDNMYTSNYLCATSVVKSYNDVIDDLKETQGWTCEFHPYFYIASEENVMPIVKKLKELNSPEKMKDFFDFVEDYIDKIDDLPEEFYIEFFDDFCEDRLEFFQQYLSQSNTITNSSGNHTVKKVCHLKRFVDLSDPDFASLNLMYELKKSEMCFKDVTEN